MLPDIRETREMLRRVGEVADIALQAVEEKGLTFREALYLPEMIESQIKKEIERRNEPFKRKGRG